LERELARLQDVGLAVVALGLNDQSLHLGNVPVDKGNWKHVIRRMVDAAAIIVVMPSDTRGTAWELDRIVLSGALVKTVFVMAPTSGTDGRVGTQWNAAASRIAFNVKLPPYDQGGCLLVFNNNGTVRVREELRGDLRNFRSALRRILRILQPSLF